MTVKNKIIALAIITTITATSGICAVANGTFDEKAVAVATENTNSAANELANVKIQTPDAKWTVDDVKEIPNDIISGIDNIKLEQNSSRADIASLVKYDKDVVKSVTVDDSKVKYNVPGTYEVVYMMEINLPALEKKAPESKTVKKTVTTITKGGGGEMKEDGFFTVSATVDITIVTTEEAEDLRDKGETVVTEKDTGVQKENDKNYAGNKNNSTSTTTKPESNKNNNTASNTNSNKTESNAGSNKQDTNKTESKPSGSATKPSGSTDKPSKHTHNWVAHTETKVVKAAYDEPVYEEQPVYEDKPIYKDVPLYEEQPIYETQKVCGCGAILPADAGLAWMRENGHSGHGYANRNVQIGTQSVQIGTESILVGMDQVQVGTEKVQVDTIHHDAITETVTTYTCSCGATK